MLKAIADATDGLGVQILDPAVETLFGAVMGSRSGLVSVPNGALFLDLGGGSVQMTWVDTTKENYEINAAAAGQSLPYGAAKLTKVLQQESAEVQAKEISTLQDGIAGIYSNLCARFPALRAIKEAYDRGEDASVDVYMCGGGFRGYGSMLMHNDPISPYPIPSTHTFSVPGTQFKQPTKMRQVNDEYDGKIHGMSKRRRQQFPAVATVIEAFIAVVPNLRRVTFCGGSNRQGVLLMKMPMEIRESNPLEVLANVTDVQRPIFDAILGLLRAAIPAIPGSLDRAPIVLAPGLGLLFVQQIWAGSGYSSSTNSSYALHHTVVRDPECPGLTHLARALLALTTCARWGNDIGPSDASLWRALRGVADSHHSDASFWALYIGAVANVLATLFPVMPQNASELLSAVR
jgi:retrograde regulation protein 2